MNVLNQYVGNTIMNRDDILISVLIPVYNAEKHIRRCLQSIVSQSYKNMEILVLDDGSKDGSLELIRNFALVDPRIRLISKSENTGVSEARNALISECSGDYIMFVDADDYIEQHAVSTIVASLGDGIDLVFFQYKFEDKGFNRKPISKYISPGRYSLEELAKHHLRNPKTIFWGVLWNKCFKREIIQKHNLTFCRILEDVVFVMQYFKCIEKALVIDDVLYVYNIATTGSLTRKLRTEEVNLQSLVDKWEGYKYAYDYLTNIYKSIYLNKLNTIRLCNYLFEVYLIVVLEARKAKVPQVVPLMNDDHRLQECILSLGYFRYLLRLRFYLKTFIQNLKRITRKAIVSVL